MSGPFGNPAMVSSGGGGGGPHLTGALQFGTKGSNPAMGSIANAALGVIDMTPWYNEVASRNGGTIGYTYQPYSTTVSFWIKGYVSNPWAYGYFNYPLGGQPSGNTPTLSFMCYEGGSRDAYCELKSRSLAGFGGTDVATISHYKSRGFLYDNNVGPSSTNHDTVVNGETAGWDHIVIQTDWHLNSPTLGTYVSGVTETQACTVYVNGNPTPTTYYDNRSFMYTYEGYPWMWDDRQMVNGYNTGAYTAIPFATFVNSNAWHDPANEGAGSVLRWFANEYVGSVVGPLSNGYHGLLANLQIFPWRVEPSELGYDNAGVWSSKAYAGNWRQDAYYMQHERLSAASYVNWTETYGHYGELWGINYDFSDPINWHQDMSGNGQHFFTSLGPNNTNPNASGYITHQTNDLPPM